MQLRDQANQFIEDLNASQCRVVLTGAGVSTASGIPDFRSTGGLFSKISQRTFELDFFYDDPLAYYKIAVEHIHTLSDMIPNATHSMLARLEQAGSLQGIITQNIDGLHQKAGAKNVFEFHGDVVSFYCTNCDKPFDRQAVENQVATDVAPTCDQCDGIIRPGITFYGDMIKPDILEAAYALSERADLFIVMGSSLNVQPAASLAGLAKQNGAKLIIINFDSTPYDRMADTVWQCDLETFSQTVINYFLKK